MLNVDSIHTYYGSGHILHGVSLDVSDSQVVGLLGRNGAGKTTLVRSIMGLTPASQGKITFKGRDITRQSPSDIAHGGIGYVPQGRKIFPSLTVYENMSVACHKPENLDKEPWTIDDVFDVFPRLKERAKNYGNQLSGGEQQMLAIGRALVTNPSLVVMDEPTEGLAPVIVKEVLSKLITMLKLKGYPVLLVEQNMKFALKYTDIVYLLANGNMVYNGTSKELESNEEIKAKYLGI